MRIVAALIYILSILHLYAQAGGQPVESQDSSPPSLPHANLTFSQPSLGSPLPLPSSIMDGAPACGPEGRAFIKFLTPPPMYNNAVIYSIAPDGKTIHYAVEQISGIKNASVISFDPGTSNAAMLLIAADIGQMHASSVIYYLALFDYDGRVRANTKLNLGFEPSKVLQLNDNNYLVIGTDTAEARSKFEVIDDSGRAIRDLNADAIMPSDQKLKAMLNSVGFVGASPADFPPSMRIASALSLFRPVHSDEGLLLLEPGAGAQIFELLRSGETRMIKLGLPKDQIADSIIVNKRRWFVRTFLKDSDNESNLYEVDAGTGEAIRRINTTGVPATSIACANDSGFYGLRWIERKPYLIFGDLR